MYTPHSVEFSTKRRIFDKGPEVFPADDEEDSDSDSETNTKHVKVETKFYEWCCGYFAQSVMKPPDDLDQNSASHIEREWRFLRNTRVRQQSTKQIKQSGRLLLFNSTYVVCGS